MNGKKAKMLRRASALILRGAEAAGMVKSSADPMPARHQSITPAPNGYYAHTFRYPEGHIRNQDQFMKRAMCKLSRRDITRAVGNLLNRYAARVMENQLKAAAQSKIILPPAHKGIVIAQELPT